MQLINLFIKLITSKYKIKIIGMHKLYCLKKDLKFHQTCYTHRSREKENKVKNIN